MGEIKVNYDKVTAVANDISKCAKKIENLSSTIKSQSEGMEGQWKGLSKQAYDELVIKWINQSKSLINDLEQISSTIKVTANKYKAADEKASNDLNKYI